MIQHHPLINRIVNMLRPLLQIKIILLIAFLVRLAYAGTLFYKNGTAEFCDDYDYINYAKDIIEQGPMVLHLNEESQVVGPAWPLIITPFIAIFNDNFWPVIFLNILLSTAQVYVIYLLGLRMFKNKNIALIAAAWASFYVPFFNYTPFVLKENFNQFFLAFCLLYFLKAAENGKIWSRDLLIFVLSYSIFVHGDERYFFYFPLIFIGLAAIGPHKKQNLLKAVAAGTLLFISMLPWLYRNHVFYGRPVILTIRTAGLTDKFFGYNAPVNFEGLSPYDAKNVPLFTALADSLKAGHEISANGVKPSYRNSLKTAIQEGIDVQPYSKFRHYWEEFEELWRPVRFREGMLAYGFRYEKQWFWYSNLIYGLSYGLLLPFMLIGLAKLLRNRDKHFWVIVLVLLLHTILHVFVAHVRTRYRYPIDSLVILSGVYGIFAVLNRFFPSQKEEIKTIN